MVDKFPSAQSIIALNEMLLKFRNTNIEKDLIDVFRNFLVEFIPCKKVAAVLLHPADKVNVLYPILDKIENIKFDENPADFFRNHIIKDSKQNEIYIVNLHPYRLTKAAFAVLPSPECLTNTEFYQNLLSLAGNIFFRRWLDIRYNFGIYPYENHFNMIVENMNEGIMIVNNDDKIIYANKRFCAMTENTLEGIIGKNAPSILLLSDDQKKIIEEKIKERKEGSIDSYELSAKTKSGKDLHMFIHGMPLINEAGDVMGSIGVCTDVTDFRNKEILLQESLKEKEILLREIHHRVKNNLALISGLLELQLLSDNEQKAADVLRMSINRIHSIGLIHDQLYMHERLDKININDYLLNLISHIQNSMANKKSKVHFHVHAADCPLSINQAVPCGILVTEVVMNSLKHAFKNADSGQITIEFSLSGNEILMIVADDGAGLPNETEGKKKKNSLGTTIISSMVRQLSGTLEITSEKGVKYAIRFPIEN